VLSPEGPPLLIIAPKQGTYQLEQQLLGASSLAGYTRLRILSFEALAHFILNRLRSSAPRILDEEGRVMVLRNLLSKRRESLKLFRASARLTGFAQQLSLVLREFQRQQVTPQMLEHLASKLQSSEGLVAKLQDLAALLQSYLDWLDANHLQDTDSLLSTAAAALRTSAQTGFPSPRIPDVESGLQSLESGRLTPLCFSRVWVDGFSEFSEQELDLLTVLVPYCEEASVTFCLDPAQRQKHSWLSHWSTVSRTFENCRQRLASVPGAELETEPLGLIAVRGRFTESPVLRHLATHWGEPLPLAIASPGDSEALSLEKSLRVAVCADPEAEARLAAREILRHVRAGGRYRDIAVIVRHLESYHAVLQRVFSRYVIPFFLDRRESVAHHPLAELTRSALRTVGLGWQHEDWFASLKSGLMPCHDKEVDVLENEALARGWRGNAWLKPIRLKDNTTTEQDRERLRQLENRLERIRRDSVRPFETLLQAMSAPNNRLSGPQLAAAIRGFWEELGIEQRLADWAEGESEHQQSRVPVSVHETVWNQVNAWLDNAELAFPDETLTLKEWLPILEAGLANLTVGIIPPALDQVLIGAVDRSRTPNIKLALILGLNEAVFPALAPNGGLLNETDRLELEKRDFIPGSSARHHLSRERYLVYIACTRPSERLVLTCSQCDAQGAPLNQSVFLSHVRRLFPSLEFESETAPFDWRASEHVNELIVPLLRMGSGLALNEQQPVIEPAEQTASADFSSWPLLSGLLEAVERVRHLQSPRPDESLSPELAGQLYGTVLRSSVSRMEQFAACPFKFFVHSGLRAEERKLFELDVKEQGTFQHDVLALFHQELRADGKRWRDITPQEARDRVEAIARGLSASYREGLLEASEQTRFMARVLTESLQDFVEVLVGWMREQYRFDPVAVELPFGTDESSPAWTFDLGQGRKLKLDGRIDRIDLHQDGKDEALCVVVDYKSSQKQLDSVLVAHGLQLQLLTYLNVLRRWPTPNALFSVKRLIPAGVFYVSLRGQYDRQPNRVEALAETEAARKQAYRHSGRFDTRFLPQLDSRSNVCKGDQFNFRLTGKGKIHQGSREALTTAQFQELLDEVEENLKKMGVKIFSGVTAVAPYRKGTDTACGQCAFQSICRVDPWTQVYRVLKAD
jgi:ATP-dependent helicase/nuclease subunit B